MFRQAAIHFNNWRARAASAGGIGDILRRRMVILLAVLGIVGIAGLARAVVITCDALCGSQWNGLKFDITTTSTAYSGGTVPQSTFQAQPWWGCDTCAARFAQLANQAGLAANPEFAYTTSPCGTPEPDPGKVCAYHSTNFNQQSEFQAIDLTQINPYAFATLLPEIDGAGLPKVALLIFSVYALRRFRRHAI